MELIPSVSRSSGLEKDGNALLSPKVQEEYRAFIQEKIDAYWVKYPLGSGDDPMSEQDAINKREIEGNLLILLRKLREGLLSIKRRDAFAQEAYETSLHLAVLFKSPVQITSTLSHLFPDFYVVQRHPRQTSSSTRSKTVSPRETLPPPSSLDAEATITTEEVADARPGALSSTLILLLHHLATAYPSQVAFFTQLRKLHPSLQAALRAPASLSHRKPSSASPRSPSSAECPAPSETPPPPPSKPELAGGATPIADSQQAKGPGEDASPHEWLRGLARCLRRRDYASLAQLARPDAYLPFVRTRPSAPARTEEPRRDRREAVATAALGALVDALVERARATAWGVLRAAYRELSLRAPGEPTGTTATWLARSLTLGAWEEDADAEGVVERWLEGRRARGEARRKEGDAGPVEGRWVLVR
ncbi:uncharacterized protein BXZ73DRAFT_50634 [Epithele typhae]|uniref:uncharacterized protein n=1 Tax=Epithele typhae TaxID=378194 RepID=UPI0020089ACF|nr:uncharacterized protein BXZ73DRAFT_50634 [Epithele typhae]KAH9924308.1 hypothetical protein BXZ73DRAFT_50634 [Epithele typhae]